MTTAQKLNKAHQRKLVRVSKSAAKRKVREIEAKSAYTKVGFTRGNVAVPQPGAFSGVAKLNRKASNE